MICMKQEWLEEDICDKCWKLIKKGEKCFQDSERSFSNVPAVYCFVCGLSVKASREN